MIEPLMYLHYLWIIPACVALGVAPTYIYVWWKTRKR